MDRTWKRRRLPGLAAIGFSSVLAMTGTATAADRPATPATFPQVFAAAQPGDTVLLAAGAYGTWTGGSKAGTVTVRPADGANPTIRVNFGSGVSNIRLDGFQSFGGATIIGSRNITISNSRFTSGATVRDGASGIVFDGDRFDGLGTSTWEGRLSINLGANGTIVRNSHFGGGGCSDGVFVGDASGTLIEGNEFDGMRQGSCAAHVDSIQLYDGPRTTIRGNYFHDSDTHIMAPDGGVSSVVTDNVFVGAGYRPTVQLGSHSGTVLSHNTVRNAALHMDSKTGGTPSRNGVVRDNVLVNGDINTTNGNGCLGCTVANNLMSGAQFVGGPAPVSYSGHRLVLGSPGSGDASDGGDRGIRVTTDPTPTPSPTPSPTPTPSPSPSPSPTPEPAYLPACRPTCDETIAQLRADKSALTQTLDQLRARIAEAIALLEE